MYKRGPHTRLSHHHPPGLVRPVLSSPCCCARVSVCSAKRALAAVAVLTCGFLDFLISPSPPLSFRLRIGRSPSPSRSLPIRRKRLRSAGISGRLLDPIQAFPPASNQVYFERMDPEDSSDFEEEEENGDDEEEEEDDDDDDELMLFILPALYLATTEIETPGQTSKRSAGTGIKTTGQASVFGDAKWICKVLEDDRGQGYGKLRVEPRVLLELSRFLRSNNLLRNTKGVSVEGKIGIFIYMLSRNASFQKLSGRFKHSTETIHRHIKACFDAVTAMTGEFVKPPSTQTHSKISSDPCYGPYFENCIGAIDGIHVPMTISDSEAAPYRNRQESISQNVMLACDFDLNFVYVSCGREGSASDAAVLYSAIESGFQVPVGKYFLVDGGYANTPSFLAPYIDVPYHTEEQEQSNFQPRDYRELFNLRHAQLHGHIKRAVGLLKMRFPILNVATSYRKDTQLKIPAAAVALHNVIQRQGGDEELLSGQTIPFVSRKTVSLPSGDDMYGYDVAAFNNECDMGNALRDGIAQRMWADYERSMYMSVFGIEQGGLTECQG